MRVATRRAFAPLQRRLEWQLKNLAGSSPEAAPRREIFLAIAEMRRRSERTEQSPAALDLTPYELRVFSQNGEDGVLDEILRRIGPKTRTFVEFGTEAGIEANCVYLADVAGWRGHFLEADGESYRSLAAKYAMNSRVTTTQAFVTEANVEAIFADLAVPEDLDILSIDVDGHDYWIWKAVAECRPRVVVIEYNGALADVPLVVPRDSPSWGGTDYFGASLRALRNLGGEKGYRFVYSDLSGGNAFFVRADLGGEFLPDDQVLLRSTNYRLTGHRHPPGQGTYISV
jgi:hypothetical protein